MQQVGFGDTDSQICIYIEHSPKFSEFCEPPKLVPLPIGAIDIIANACGNGWRKIFNVYAKFAFQLAHEMTKSADYQTWQIYRDQQLLQIHSNTCLLFSPPELKTCSKSLHIIAGRTYATKLLNTELADVQVHWINKEFAICPVNRLIICPFLDYRQLSNEKITMLVNLCKQLD